MHICRPKDYRLLRFEKDFSDRNPHKYLPEWIKNPIYEIPYDTEFDINVIWVHLARFKPPGPLSFSYPIFCLIYRETLLHSTYQRSFVQGVPYEYYSLLLIYALLTDIEGRWNIRDYLEGTSLNKREWDILAETMTVHTLIEDLAQEKKTVPDVLRGFLLLSPENIRIDFQIAKAVYMMKYIARQCDLTDLTNRISPLIDLIEFDLQDSPMNVEMKIQESPHSAQLLWLCPENLDTCIQDPECPYSSNIEISEATIRKVTGLSKKSFRRSLIRSLWTYYDISEIPSGQFSPIDEDMFIWYQQTGENKLSRESLNSLCEILRIHERTQWDEQRIEMRVQHIISPSRTWTCFCREYDQEIYQERKDQVCMIMDRLRYLFRMLGPNTQDSDLFKQLEDSKSFYIPILSPRGLMMLYRETSIMISPFLTDLFAEILKNAPDWRKSQGIDGIYNQRDARKVLIFL